MADLLSLAWCLPVLPLLAGVFGLCCHRRHAFCTGAAIAAHAVATVLAGAIAATWLASGAPATTVAVDWLPLHAEVVIRLGARLDPLAVLMLVVVEPIALLVSIYSIGYMRDDPGAGRFQALLALFAAAMLALVLAPNLGQLFVAWELVGVTSYLLIGFWWHRPSAVSASKKAFVVTRFADAFFLVGLILLALAAGSLDHAALFTPAAAAALAAEPGGARLLAWGTGLVFVGAWGKSAMFPLHIWLPDAMQGPTPVSSIIHSATMVVAGVFLTARMFPLADPAGTLVLAEVTGALTAVFAAAVACVQRDIKRLLAFSTLSQLGYMMFALGVASTEHPAGYAAGMFHVFTHAWSKCLLFLGAGIVIHAVHTQDLTRMGGLRRHLPGTWLAMLAACLAISGIPPFAGFASKDAILAAAWGAGHHEVFVLALGVGALTAFYMFRMFLLAFHGAAREAPADAPAIREHRVMLVPVLILALGTLAAGYPVQGLLDAHLRPPGAAAGHAGHPAWLPWLASALGGAGIALAWLRYGRGARLAPLRSWRRALAAQLGCDAAWRWLLRVCLLDGAARHARACDRSLVDGSLTGVADTAHALGLATRYLHNGLIARYLLVMAAAAVVALAVLGGGR